MGDKQERFENENYTIIPLEESMIKLVFKTTHVTVDIAKEVHARGMNYASNNKLFILANTRGFKSMEKSARQHLAEATTDAGATATAVALIIESGITKAIANFFISLNKPPYHCKMFTSEKAALNWLKEIKNNAGKKDVL